MTTRTVSAPGIRILAVLFSLLTGLCAGSGALALESPSAFLKTDIGADRTLIKWDDVVRYARHVDQESPRIRVMDLGTSTLGRPFLLVAAGDPETIANLDHYREGMQLLRNPDRDPAAAAEFTKTGKVVVLFTLNVHSIEIGASQESVELFHELATNEEPWMQEIRDNVILLIIPSMNPDGMDLVVDWYRETLGTEAEGTYPIELYHPYSGHDNNRDGFFNNLVETQHLSRVMYHDWLPQVILDQHQMGSTGPRLFLPPFDDPVSETVHPLVYSQLSAAAQQMVSDLHGKGWRGIVTQDRFTAEWPGSIRSTGFWHNVIGILSEAASVRIATPLHFPPGSLTSSSRGLPEYERRTNFLDPWPGGWWSLRNIIDIEKDLSWSLLRWCAQHREELLFNFMKMNQEAVTAGRSEPPYGFVWSLDGQHDSRAGRRLAQVLRQGGVTVERVAGPVTIEGCHYASDVAVVSAAQPYRPYILEMMGAAPYPTVRETPGGPLVNPYDVTAWSLPDFLGVSVQTLTTQNPPAAGEWTEPAASKLEGPRDARRWILSDRAAASFTAVSRLLKAGARVGRRPWPLSSPRDRRSNPCGAPSEPEAGSWIIEAGSLGAGLAPAVEKAVEGFGLTVTAFPGDRPPPPAVAVPMPRIGLYSPWGGSMDEGWTRLVLDRAEIPYVTIHNEDLRGPVDADGKEVGPAPAPLRSRFDAILIPDISVSELEKGEYADANAYSTRWPARYLGGLGKARTIERLKTFVKGGGTLLAFDSACPYLIEHMGLPARSVLSGLSRDEFDAPGTLVRIDLDRREPLAWGMPETAAAWFARSQAFQPIGWDRPTGVPARYASDPDELRVKGYLRGADHLAGKAAALDIPMGEGHVVLIGFRPQNRGQMEGTFKLVFNALFNAPGAWNVVNPCGK